MVNKISTTKNNLIEDIINYKVGDSAARNEMTAKVVALAMDMLSKDYMVNHPLHIRDDKFNRVHETSEFQPTDWKIMTTPLRFQEVDKLGSDILTLGHEVKHYADKSGAKDPNAKYISAVLHRDVMATFLSEYMVSGTLLNQVPNVKNNNREMKDIRKKEISDYLFGKYWDSKSEKGARMFSYQFCQEIIDYSNTMGELDEQAKANVASIQDALDHERVTDYLLSKKYATIVDGKNAVMIEAMRRARADMTRSRITGESVLDMICLSQSAYDYNLLRALTNESLNCIEETLHIDYDEDFANTLFDSLMKNNNPMINSALLNVARNLINCTPFLPNAVQQKKLENKIRVNNMRIIDEDVNADIIDINTFNIPQNDKEICYGGNDD